MLCRNGPYEVIYASYIRQIYAFLPRTKTTSSVLATLDTQLSSIASQRTAHAYRQTDHDALLQANLHEVERQTKEKDPSRSRGKIMGMDRMSDMGGSGAGPSGVVSMYDEAMDVDDPKGLLSPQSSQTEKKKGWKCVWSPQVLSLFALF